MNHLDRIRQDRELIGLENFKSLSLDQLLDAIDQNFPTGLGRKRMIQTFITWLHDCLVDSEVSDGPALRSRVRDWVAFLRKCQNSDRTILDTFREYQNCELIRIEESKLKEKEAENPRAAKTHIGGAQAEEGILKEGKTVDSKNKKRAHEEPVPAKAKLSIIAIELEKYLNSFPTQSSVSESTSAPAPGPPAPNSTATNPPPNSRYGYMHPDRMPTLSGSRYNSTLTDRMGTPPGPRSVRKQPEKVTPRPGATFGNIPLDKMPLLSRVRTVRAHPNDKALPPEGQYGQMHPDRMKISQKLGSEIEMNCDGDLQTASFSLRNTSGRSDNFHNEHLGLKKNLSFLTGSNRMVLDDTMRVRDPPTLRSKNKSTGDDSGHEAKRPRLEERPRVGRRSSCGLCGGDHLAPQDCPAKFAAREGRIPRQSYQCARCKRFGAHYTADCSQKKDTGVGRPDDRQNSNPQTDGQSQREEQRPSSWDGLYQEDPLQRLDRPKHRVSSSGQKLVDKDVKTGFQPSGHGYGSLALKGLTSTSDPPLSGGKHDQTHNKEHPHETIQEGSKSVRKIGALAGDLVVQHKAQTEGRLSYYDEKDGQQLSKSIQTGTPSVVHKPAQKKKKKKKQHARFVSPVPGSASVLKEIGRAQLDDLVMEMIKSESNRIKLPPAASSINPPITRLSLGQPRADIVEDQFSRLWVNTQDNLANAQQPRPAVKYEEAKIPVREQPGKLSVNNSLEETQPETTRDSFIHNLFKRRKVSWTTKKRRPCATDFFGALPDTRTDEEKPVISDTAMEIEQSHTTVDRTADILATPSSVMEVDKPQRDPKPVIKSAIQSGDSVEIAQGFQKYAENAEIQFDNEAEHEEQTAGCYQLHDAMAALDSAMDVDEGLQDHERMKSKSISEMSAHANEPFTQIKSEMFGSDAVAGIISDSAIANADDQQPTEMAVDQGLIKIAVVETVMETIRSSADHFRRAKEAVQEKQNDAVIDSTTKVTSGSSTENKRGAVKASPDEQHRVVLTADNFTKAGIGSLVENSQTMKKVVMDEQATNAAGKTAMRFPCRSPRKQIRAGERDLNVTVTPEAVMRPIAASTVAITMDLEQVYSPLIVTTQDDGELGSSQSVMDGLGSSDSDCDRGHSVSAHQEDSTAATMINRGGDSVMADDTTIEPNARVRDR